MSNPETWTSPCGTMTLVHGRYQDVLTEDVICAAEEGGTGLRSVITDPPYGVRTHASGETVGDRQTRDGRNRRSINYTHWDANHVKELVAAWAHRAGWLCVMTSHELTTLYENETESNGRIGFAPVVCVQTGMGVRIGGDGPSNWSVYLMVSRPRTIPWSKWGTLPGAYVGNAYGGQTRKDRIVVGGKPMWLMEVIVRDYSRPGDLVIDPCAGGATTLLAAARNGRRAIGAEMDRDTFDKAVARLSQGYTAPLFAKE